jgi:hypothetical protein
LGCSWGALAALEVLLGSSWSLLGWSWGLVGCSWGALGVVLGVLGGSLGVLGISLGTPWGSLGPPGDSMETPWGFLWGSCELLGVRWVRACALGGPLAATLRCLGHFSVACGPHSREKSKPGEPKNRLPRVAFEPSVFSRKTFAQQKHRNWVLQKTPSPTTVSFCIENLHLSQEGKNAAFHEEDFNLAFSQQNLHRAR